jgi:hypothetical protein
MAGSSVETRKMLPFRQYLRQYLFCSYLPPEDNRALLQRSGALLERWLDHPDAEKMWDTIRARSEQQDGPVGADAPSQFIFFILEAKLAAEKESRMNVELAAAKAEAMKLKAEVTKGIAVAARRVPFEKRAKFLEDAAKQLQQCPPAVISPPRVRSDQKGSRARTYFIRHVSGLIHDITGRWLDEQVAMITAIAFDTDVSNDAVRKIRSE